MDLCAPAGAPFTIRLVSDEAVPHGLEVTDASGRVVFTGENFAGPGERTYALPALTAGRYRFDDPIHPNMAGTLHVGESAPEPPSAFPAATLPPPDVAISISGTDFSPDQVTFAGGRRFSIQLVNDDPGVEHGIRIVDALGAYMFEMQNITGPGTFRYPVDALPDGTYTIIDPVHPELRATLVIGG